MVTQMYDEILRMILKRIRYNNVVKGSGDYTQFIPMLTSETPSSTTTDDNTDMSNPYNVVGLDNFDYHLLYNLEEEMIGFTSNNGTWNWVLNKDSFEDLITIDVTNPITPFRIALIFEFYDIRKDVVEVSEKGKLTDVILLAMDNSNLVKTLVVEPSTLDANPGDTMKFVAKLGLQNGTTVDVTDTCTWSIQNIPTNSTISISNGVVTNADTGTYMILASIQGLSCKATLNVKPLILQLYPGDSVIDINDTITFSVISVKANGTMESVLGDQVTWQIAANNNTDPLPTVTNGAITNTSNSGKYTVTAIYQGNLVRAKLEIKAPILLIDPVVLSIREGDFAKFNALLSKARTVTGVTSLCDWSINSASVNMDNNLNKGYISNTYGNKGTYTIQATYGSLLTTAKLNILPAEFYLAQDNKTINQNETTSFRAYYKDPTGIVTDITDNVTWSIESPCVISNTIGNKGIVTNTTTSGTYGIVATNSSGLQANGTLTVVEKSFSISPSSQSCGVGEEVQFEAYFTDKDGSVEVTNGCVWSINTTKCTISRGRVAFITEAGTYTITAVLNGMTTTASLTVHETTLTISPNTIQAKTGEIVKFTAFSDTNDVTNSFECIWKVDESDVDIAAGVVSNLYTTRSYVTVSATYRRKTATSTLNVKQVSLILVPDSLSLVQGSTGSFKAYLRSEGEADTEVTSNCTWMIDGPLAITQSGDVGNTVQMGNYNVKVSYNPSPKLIANTTVQVAEKSITVHDSTVTLQIRDWGIVDGDTVKVKLNNGSWSDEISLIDSWTNVSLNLSLGTNYLKIGACKNGSLIPITQDAGYVSAGIRALNNSGVIVIPESMLEIVAPTTGDERLALDPNTYNKVWSIVLN